MKVIKTSLSKMPLTHDILESDNISGSKAIPSKIICKPKWSADYFPITHKEWVTITPSENSIKSTDYSTSSFPLWLPCYRKGRSKKSAVFIVESCSGSRKLEWKHWEALITYNSFIHNTMTPVPKSSDLFTIQLNEWGWNEVGVGIGFF